MDLRDTGIQPEDVYSRKIVAGWIYPPSTPLPHLSLGLDLLDLHNDRDFDPSDGEMTFWWMGVDRAPSYEWHRLVNWEVPTYQDVTFPCPNHMNQLNDMDDDFACGNGLLEFSGPEWNFYLRHGQSLNVHTSGFEQDCLDDYFGSGHFALLQYVDCYTLEVFAFEAGNNDPLPPMDLPFVGTGVDPLTQLGSRVLGIDDEFHFRFTFSQVPLADEETRRS